MKSTIIPSGNSKTGKQNVTMDYSAGCRLLHIQSRARILLSLWEQASIRYHRFDDARRRTDDMDFQRDRLVEAAASGKAATWEKLMRGMVAAFIGSFALSLCACGGGGGGGAPQSVAASSPVQPQPKTVLIEEYGDSTTQGYQTANGAGVLTPNSEPVVLQRLLRAKFGSNVTVSNQGVSGTEASQLFNGADGVHGSWLNQMASSKADIVTINFELNDAFFSKTPTPGALPESPSDYASYMTQLVQVAKAAGKRVILFEPNPTIEPTRVELTPAYLVALQSVAAAQNVPLVSEFDPIRQTPGWQSMLTDEVHPSDALYAIKAQLEFPTIEPIVQALLAD